MKKKVLGFASCACLIVLLFTSCGGGKEKPSTSGKETVDTTKVSVTNILKNEDAGKGKEMLDSSNFSKEVYTNFLRSFYNQKAKLKSGSICDSQYCGKDSCLQKIVAAHHISEATFDSMTLNKHSGHAEFDTFKINNIVNDASCYKQIVQYRVNGKFYTITRMAKEDKEIIVYYSVALLQGLKAKGTITSVDLYKGVKINSTDEIVPFAVHYGNVIEYYDVSDSQP